MATGMVLIIVSRNIDLSVGSLLGFLGYTMALVQTDGMIAFFGLDVTIGGLRSSSYAWLVALAVGAVLGALVGGLTGFIVAYGGVPSFIVTLGGFLVWRGAIFRTGDKQGQTLAPLDETFQLIGGGARGTLGEWRSWLLAILGCAGVGAQHLPVAPAPAALPPRRAADVGRRGARRRRLRGRGGRRRADRQPLRLARDRRSRWASPTRW